MVESRHVPSGGPLRMSIAPAVDQLQNTVQSIEREVAKVLVGQQEVVRGVVISLLVARGHCLLAGVPGLGKTLLVRVLAEVVVHTCVPPDQRGPIARLCAARGKHLLLEKPMARNVAEADEILALCDRAGITVGAMFQNRFTPLAQKLKAAVEQSKLGQLLLVNVSAKWYRHAEYYQNSSW